MLKNGRPYHLPQLNLEYAVVLEKLDKENINYNVIQINPNENDGIQSSQKLVYSDEISGVHLDDNKPIWIANNNICDGHHRYFKAMFETKPIMAVKLDMDFMDACRILNKIQDIHEYEQSQGLEEVEDQDAINFYQKDEDQFLNTLEEDNFAIQTETPTKNQKTIVGYRKDPIKENSVVGNFFTLKPVAGYDKYEIDFENLMDTNSLGVTYKDGQEPVDILAKIWFPHVNFEKLSTQHNTSSINLKTKAIAEKAMKIGYDGIKYGDSIIQGLK
jgi:hypothetical protein